jgi:hypothetical protein
MYIHTYVHICIHVYIYIIDKSVVIDHEGEKKETFSPIKESSSAIKESPSSVKEPSSAIKESSSEIQETSMDIVESSLGEQGIYNKHKYECIHRHKCIYLCIYRKKKFPIFMFFFLHMYM